MCGILCVLSRTGCEDDQSLQNFRNEIIPWIRVRGPDSQGHQTVACGGANGPTLDLYGSLLQLRGASPSASPLLDDATGCILVFNGEIFGGIDIPDAGNDARQLLCCLAAVKNSCEVPQILGQLQGPWAFVFWHQPSETLWFGRDSMGQRSLLCTQDLTAAASGTNATSVQMPFALCSVSSAADAAVRVRHEVPPGVYCVALGSSAMHPTALGPQSAFPMEIVTWPACFPRDYRHAEAAIPGAADATAPDEEAMAAVAETVLHALRAAVAVRCAAIRGSSGASRCQAPGTASPAHTCPSLGAPSTCDEPGCPARSSVSLQPPAPVMILFSGGVDSMLLAALTHEALPPDVPIDLVSICFDGGASPDRRSAMDGLEELADAAPRRLWRLIRVDASLDDVDAHAPRLLRLLRPADTVMDLNIGAALWLAALAMGSSARIWDPTARQFSERCGGPCTSDARVVFVGHGADELCGGYGRHRTRYREGGWQGLDEEMALDLDRLWLRNLGRDDRLIADHGREARHPFLDEAVIAAVRAARLDCIVDLRQGVGQGDKIVLRRALVSLRFIRAAARVKRAIQFGTRIGKHSNVRQFGGTRKANMASAGGVRLTDVPAPPATSTPGSGVDVARADGHATCERDP